MKETSVEYVAGEKTLVWFTAEYKFIKRIKALQEKHPDEVHIVAENDDGSIMARLPISWFRAPGPRVKRPPLSEEQRAASVARLKAARDAKNLLK